MSSCHHNYYYAMSHPAVCGGRDGGAVFTLRSFSQQGPRLGCCVWRGLLRPAAGGAEARGTASKVSVQRNLPERRSCRGGGAGVRAVPGRGQRVVPEETPTGYRLLTVFLQVLVSFGWGGGHQTCCSLLLHFFLTSCAFIFKFSSCLIGFHGGK